MTMGDYRVNLDIFAGPLDLLLYLVRKDEMDIYDIPIADITSEYVRYVEMLKNLDMDLVGDFLVMAATLMEIKSAMLLPKAQPDQISEEDLDDPRMQLVKQLLEYKKFKDAANLLGGEAKQQNLKFNRPANIINKLNTQDEPEVDLDQIGLWDLLEAFDTILKATGGQVDLSSIKDDTPIDLYQIEILHRLQSEGPMVFERIFEGKDNRLAMVGLFLAMLELIREKLLWVEQPAALGPIYLRSLTDEPAEEAVKKAIMATEAQLQAMAQSAAQGEVQTEKPPIPISEIPAKPSGQSEQFEPVESSLKSADNVENTASDSQNKS